MSQGCSWKGSAENYERSFEIMLPKKQRRAFSDFYDSARHNEILEPKTTLLVHMATAMAVGCYP
jgi:hypothetical protein